MSSNLDPRPGSDWGPDDDDTPAVDDAGSDDGGMPDDYAREAYGSYDGPEVEYPDRV